MSGITQAPPVSQGVQITVSSKQHVAQLELHEGESALVGSGVGCQLRLQDDAVAPHQCMLQLRAGILVLDNWSTDQSTHVNGVVVNDVVELTPQDCVSFGDYIVRFHVDADSKQRASKDSAETIDTLQNDPPKKKLASNPASVSTMDRTLDTRQLADVEQSTIAILHSEIEFLQHELAQRDEALTQKPALVSPTSDTNEPSSSHARVNELLRELDVCDARITDLTNELQILEEVRESENAERSEFNAWVNEIESLIAKREEELRAEMEIVKNQLQQERAERLSQQKRADDGAEGNETAKEMLRKLREEHETTRTQLANANGRCAALQRECLTLREANTDAAVDKRVHDALREERLQLAHERACVSRKEHELIRKLRETECLSEKESRSNRDPSFQELRETLNECQDDQTSAKPSIGKRLVKIWDRLDGPTDRD